MKIVFLGGTRFIGHHAVLAAEKRGHEVIVLHRGIHSTPISTGIEHVIVNRENENELRAAFLRLEHADVLIDTFSMTELSAQKVVTAAAGVFDRVVVLSSQDVYAQFGRLNGHSTEYIEPIVFETSPLTVPYPFRGIAEHPGGEFYDKKDVERVYREAGFRSFQSITVLRLPAVFGSGDYHRRFGEIVDQLDTRNEPLPCQDEASWRWTMSHVVNAAHAIILSAERSREAFIVFNVGDQPVCTMRERVELIAREMRKPLAWIPTEHLPDSLAHLGRMPNDFVVSTSKIRDQIGYSEVFKVADSYADLVLWCRKSRINL